jgi:hypothetical protein
MSLQAPSLASQLMISPHVGTDPTEMEMVPVTQDGEEPSPQLHAQAAGPPVGAVTTVSLAP